MGRENPFSIISSVDEYLKKKEEQKNLLFDCFKTDFIDYIIIYISSTFNNIEDELGNLNFNYKKKDLLILKKDMKRVDFIFKELNENLKEKGYIISKYNIYDSFINFYIDIDK